MKCTHPIFVLGRLNNVSWSESCVSSHELYEAIVTFFSFVLMGGVKKLGENLVKTTLQGLKVTFFE